MFSRHGRPVRSRKTIVGLCALVTLTVLASCDYNAGNPALFGPGANAPWPNVCQPFNVAILIDRSASIGDTTNFALNYNQIQSVKQAVNGVSFLGGWVPGLLDTLAATNARVWIGSFATLAKQHYPAAGDKNYYPMNNPTNLANAKAAVDWMQFAGWQTDWAGNTWYTNYDDYPDDRSDGAPGSGRTNWQGAIDAPPGVPHLTIVLTDGDPTMYNGRTGTITGGDPTEGDVNAAVNQANGSKFLGGRVIAVHFGAKNAGGVFGGWEQRLQRITGPAPNVDYFNTTFAGLRNTLETYKDLRCLPATATTLTASKTTVTVGEPVTLTYQVTNTGNVNMNAGTLTDSGRPGWSTPVAASSPGGFTTATHTFTPSTPGTSTFRATGCGTHTGTGAPVCSQSASITITVNPPAPAEVVPT